MINWSSSIPKWTCIDTVKQIQPDFIEIDWKNPIKSDSEARYINTKIKNSNDLLQMENYLSFADNKYQGRFANKWNHKQTWLQTLNDKISWRE